jgi:tRNA (guanine37-N1)-methyltransferase
MQFRIFTLYPQIFESFVNTSLIARGVSKDIIKFELVNWRTDFGTGVHKQVDDKPFGGGSGMVLLCDPIYQALIKHNALGVFSDNKKDIFPNNSKFYNYTKTNKKQKATIMLTPRGHKINQEVFEYLAEFEELNILCGRFEGFDERVSDLVDLELSIGDFVINGGEVAAMVLVEGVSRLIPEFITKSSSVEHDSFSSGLNYYGEQSEYSKMKKTPNENKVLFNDDEWKLNIAKYEHPIYTRPQDWRGNTVPEFIVNGNHALIQNWKLNWYKLN